MVSYARRACSECGVREPQPDMHQFEVTPIGVHGNYLAPRLRWLCEFCAQPHLKRIAWAEAQQADKRADAVREEVEYKKKKRLWALEEERRRSVNAAKQSPIDIG